jgi:putative endonuclease
LKRNHIKTGKTAEDLAYIFLSNEGLKPLKRNYLCSAGELDLIMKDGEVIVFIEVRARSSNKFVDAIETIDERKKSHIIRASEHFLQKHRLTNSRICRFDVILFSGGFPDINNIVWIKAAFEA